MCNKQLLSNGDNIVRRTAMYVKSPKARASRRLVGADLKVRESQEVASGTDG